MITQNTFGKVQGQDVIRYTVENQHQTRMSVLNFAGILQEFSVVDDDERINLLLSSDRIEGFTENPFNINRVIGRTAGRIKNGTWNQAGKQHTVPVNDGPNSLHGGPEGIGNQFFDVTVDADANQIVLTYLAQNVDDGFPGDLKVKVVYTLTETDEIKIDFEGQQEGEAGLFNPTVHAYFNLGNAEATNLMQHDLMINAEQHLETDQEKCPTGVFTDNAGTPFDLKFRHDLGTILPEMHASTDEQGFDDVFVVPADFNQIAASVSDRASGRQVDIYSDRNAIVAFTASQMDNQVRYLNRGTSKPWMAVALEAQMLPDTPNHSDFGDVSIDAGASTDYHIMYKYHKN